MIQRRFSKDLAVKVAGGETLGFIMTKNGHPVRLLDTEAKGDYPVVGLIDMGSYEITRQWTADGKLDVREGISTNTDLVIETEGGEA